MTLNAVFLEIPGKPLPLRRYRFCRKGSRIWTYNSQEKEMNEVRKLMRIQYPFAPLEGPLLAWYCFQMPMSKRWNKKERAKGLKGSIHPAFRPDISNMVKFYEDCMNKTIFDDDALIIHSESFKMYSEDPKTLIWIRSPQEDEMKNFIHERYNGYKVAQQN